MNQGNNGLKCCTLKRLVVSKSISGGLVIKQVQEYCKIPEVGDKFASRQGQKGVVGLIHCVSGVVGPPLDVIVNPHGVGSRMTMATLKELCCSLSHLCYGNYSYGCSFGNSLGFVSSISCSVASSFGSDYRVGEKHTDFFFVGAIYLQRLRHMSCEKTQVRSSGARNSETMQPLNGKSMGGGLRTGTMENNAILEHFALGVCKERLYLNADCVKYSCCKNCKIVLPLSEDIGGICVCCHREVSILKFCAPKSVENLSRDLNSMNVRVSNPVFG